MRIDSFTDPSFSRLGAWPEAHGVRFRVWAPKAKEVSVVLLGGRGEGEKTVSLSSGTGGYFETLVREAQVGSRYFFKLEDQGRYPDPTSRYQPEGVHGPSEVISPDFEWSDREWKGLPLEELVIYELHVGAFSPEGTFEGVRRRLQHIKNLGFTAIEIMPVAQFPGARNWGYDGVGLFATQNSYGGPDISPVELKKLVDACHEIGLAAILDVVYNHFGPEGNYLSRFGPYFQDKYHTPWGEALNYDGEWSDEVRRFFLENARQWLEEFHFDGLRLDAVHAIFDTSACPFLEDLSRLKSELETKTGRRLYLIAESDANDSRVLRSGSEGGLGMDAQWADDLHHSIHSLLTGERQGYYSDYGSTAQLASAYQNAIIYSGEYSHFRHRSHGRPYQGVERKRLVVFSQNHDQIGNRMMGERLITLTGPEKQRLAAACVFLSPYLPLVFMGEEYGETAPFLYFIDHSDPALIDAVRKGRRKEFSSFLWQGEPPDPASRETFERSKLDWRKVESDEKARSQMKYYHCLSCLSKWIRAERLLEAGNVHTRLLAEGRVVEVYGANNRNRLQIFFSFSPEVQKVEADLSSGPLEIVLNSWDDQSFSESHLPGAGLGGRYIPSSTLELRPFSAIAVRGPQI